MAVFETVLFYFASFFIPLIGISYWYFKTTYSYWNKKGVKTLPVIPLFGSYGYILTQNKNKVYVERDAYRLFPNEKFVGGFKGMNPELIVRDPEVIKMMLVKDFSYFHDRPGYHSRKGFMHKNLFMVKGNTWTALRRKVTPTFTSAKMKLMFPLIVESSEELQRFVTKSLEETDVYEIKEVLAKFTTETIGSCAFGMKMNAMTPEEALFRKIGNRIFATTKKRIFTGFIRHILPTVAYLMDLMPEASGTGLDDFFLGLVKKITETRQGPSTRHDFMDLMLELKAQEKINFDKNNKCHQGGDGEEDLEITDELIAAQAWIFFAGGFETSSSTMSSACRELALNPDIQEKLYAEIKTTLDKHGKLTYDAIQDMQYLDAVLDETMRKYPPVTHLERLCTSEYKIPGTNVVLDKGVEIIIPTHSLHYDEKHYPDPERFIPERFLPNAEKPHHPFAYLPFGEGPRNCIGMRFGKLQSAAGLIAILSKFSLEKCHKTNLVAEIEPVTHTASLIGGIWLRIRPRV